MEYTIYKICCKDESISDCYIGSTKKFIRRKSEHKYAYNNNNTNKVYQFIREHNGWDNFNISILEILICKTKDEAHKKEQEYIELFKPTLNKKNAFGFDNKLYYQNNKEQKKAYQRTYDKQRYIKQKELRDISL